MSEKQPEEAQDRAGANAGPARARWRDDRRKTWVLATIALLLVLWVGKWAYYRWTHVYIDDARIDGEVVTLSSRVSGWVTDLPVIEGDEVKQGALLVRIDSRDSVLQREALLARLGALEHQIAAMQAQTGQVDQETLGKMQSETSRLVAAEAEAASHSVQLQQASEDYKRAQDLAAQKWISPQALERARTTYQQLQENHRKALADAQAARGTLSSAGGSRRQVQVMARQQLMLERQADELRAEIRRREVDIADRTILSPREGRVVMTFVRKGEHVAAGQRILMFHDPNEIWVEANVRETDLRRLKPGMQADIRVDAYPGQVFSAEVFRIGQAATSKFALLPDPNPSGNFTKITQRLPVRFRLTDKNHALRPGMMVEVYVATRHD